MPNIQSAKKALRQSGRRRAFNDKRKRIMKDAIKEVRRLAAGENSAETAKLLSVAYQAIDKAAKRGVIKKNTANRKKSRLTRLVRKAKAL